MNINMSREQFHQEHFNENQKCDGKCDDSMNKNDDKADQENKQQFQNFNGNFYHQNRGNFGQGGHFQQHNMHHQPHGHAFGEKYQPLPPSEVTCFKCGEKGHYANKCNKGVFAFLRADSDNK